MQGGRQTTVSQGRQAPTRNLNPMGSYQSPGGYGKQPQELPWNGASNANGRPIIKGVSALDAAAKMNDYENGAGTSQAQAEQAQDQASAKLAMRKLAFEKGYEGARRKMGFGAQDTPPPVDPVAARRANLIAGGLQPNEADKAVADEAAAKQASAAVKPPGAVPVPGAVKPPAPVAAQSYDMPSSPGKSTTNMGGADGGSLGDWLATQKARQLDPSKIGPSASDAAALPAATEQAHDMQAAAAPPAPKPVAAPAVDPQQASAAANEASRGLMAQQAAQKQAAQVASNQGIVDKANADDIAATGKSLRPDTMSAPQSPAIASAPAPVNNDDSFVPVKTQPTNEEDAMKKGGPVKAAKKRMMARANGGPVGGITWEGAPPANAPQYPTAVPVEDGGAIKIGGQATQLAIARAAGASTIPVDKTVTRAKGGPAPTGPTYKVGEPGPTGKPRPELFMPHDGSAPQVLGAKGQQIGHFKKSGVVIPHHALKAMKNIFSKMPTKGAPVAAPGGGDDNPPEAPTDPHQLPNQTAPEENDMPMKKGGAVEKAKMRMRPKAA